MPVWSLLPDGHVHLQSVFQACQRGSLDRRTFNELLVLMVLLDPVWLHRLLILSPVGFKTCELRWKRVHRGESWGGRLP